MYDEEIAPRFAALLVKAAEEYGAPSLAADLALRGAEPSEVEVIAGRWEADEFDPREFATELRDFADEVRRVQKQWEHGDG